MSYVRITNHEEYTQALDELYPLLDMPPAGLSDEEAERMRNLMEVIDRWESKHSQI